MCPIFIIFPDYGYRIIFLYGLTTLAGLLYLNFLFKRVVKVLFFWPLKNITINAGVVKFDYFGILLLYFIWWFFGRLKG
jgi:hypothetical protein